MKTKVLTIFTILNFVVGLALAVPLARLVYVDIPVLTELAQTRTELVRVGTELPKYEYTIETVPDLEWGTKAQEMGQGGWALVFARRASDGEGEFMYECIFQRQKR